MHFNPIKTKPPLHHPSLALSDFAKCYKKTLKQVQEKKTRFMLKGCSRMHSSLIIRNLTSEMRFLLYVIHSWLKNGKNSLC